MGILNYTTTIDSARTVGEIQGMLAAHGARSILVDFADRQPTSISFLIKTAYGERGYKLPANVDACLKVLVRQADHGEIPRKYANRTQASRVAWRIVKDWLAAQLAIIEAEMVTLDEIFLPYMAVDSSRTLYQVLRENQLALPAGR